MEYTVLYYPSFQPDVGWLRKILLLTDRVARVVPKDADTEDAVALLDLLKVVPEGLTNLAPNIHDISLDYLSMQRLSRAFAFIAANSRAQEEGFALTIHNGSISVDGNAFLHQSKVSDEIGSLLEEHGLVRKELNQLAQDFGLDHYLVVDERASNLLLSCIADRVARRHGLDAITDRPLDFGFNASDNLGLVSLPDNPEGMLLEAIASISIPSEILEMNSKSYKEIRDSYAELRAAFKVLVAELSALNRLGRISDLAILNDRVVAVAGDFVAECEKWHRSRYSRRFKSWTPLCVGGLLSVAAAFVNPIAAGAIAAGSFAIQAVEKHITQRDAVDSRGRVYQMLVGMRHDIIEKSPIKNLV